MYKYKLTHNDWYIDVNNICTNIEPKIVRDEEKHANVGYMKSLILYAI